MIKIDSDEYSMVSVLKFFLARISGKRVPLRRTTIQRKTEK